MRQALALAALMLLTRESFAEPGPSPSLDGTWRAVDGIGDLELGAKVVFTENTAIFELRSGIALTCETGQWELQSGTWWGSLRCPGHGMRLVQMSAAVSGQRNQELVIDFVGHWTSVWTDGTVSSAK